MLPVPGLDDFFFLRKLMTIMIVIHAGDPTMVKVSRHPQDIRAPECREQDFSIKLAKWVLTLPPVQLLYFMSHGYNGGELPAIRWDH